MPKLLQGARSRAGIPTQGSDLQPMPLLFKLLFFLVFIEWTPRERGVNLGIQNMQ